MERVNGKFNLYYDDWQKNRINKIEQIFGKEYFKDKTILEVACGYGDIGKYFRENLGSNVTFAEGRKEHLPFIMENNPGSKVIELNQENLWDLGEKFDIVIHFGVTYHLDNWKQDFECAMNHAKSVMIYETEIADSKNPFGEFKFKDIDGYDQALSESKICTRPSAAYVENEIQRLGGTFVRYDDADLNANIHTYSWELSGAADTNPDYNRSSGVGMRRFWSIKK
jgi:SAM-dependent methyltransferase